MRGWVRHARFYVPRGLMVTRCIAGRHSLRRHTATTQNWSDRRGLAKRGLPRRSAKRALSPRLAHAPDKTATKHLRAGQRTAKYEVPGKDGPTVLGVETPKTLFPRGLLHSSVVAFLIVQKFALGVPHHRLEQHIKDQEVELDRGTMGRYTDEAGGALGATIVHPMWQNAISNGCAISTDATSGLVQQEKSKNGLQQPCKKGHFFTAVVDCESVLFAYTDKHTQDFVKKLFGGFEVTSRVTRATSTTSSIAGRQPNRNRTKRSNSSDVGHTAGATSSRRGSAGTLLECRV
jgi:Transposase IS66 family